MEEVSCGIVVFRRAAGVKFLTLKYEEGHWDLPKGHIEKGETKEQAALRETKEETGLDVRLAPGFEESLDYFFKDKSGKKIHKTVFFFLGETKKKDVVLSDEHLDFRWLGFEEMIDQLTYSNAKQIISKANRFLVA